MNFSIAKEILELPDNFNQETIRQKYLKLSRKFHPDKGGQQSDFVKISEAYNFLLKNPEEPIKQNLKDLNDIFRTFIKSNIFSRTNVRSFGFKRQLKLNITPREFLEGTNREVETTYKTQCNCEQMFCHACRGLSFNGCEECLGSGIVQNCDLCTNGFITNTKMVKVVVPKMNLNNIILENNIIELKLTDNQYFVNNNLLYYHYKITLKESLTGFVKIYKDPFGIEHIVKSNTIVKQNDGYSINKFIFLVFNIVYPKQLLTQLKNIDF